MFSLASIVQVALGGAAGSVLRYMTNVAAGRLFGTGFPMGTLIVNVLGSFLMGVLVVFLAEKGLTRHAPLLMTGLLGGFTTLSAFSLDTVTLWERGQTGLALAYVALTLILSLAAIVLAMQLLKGTFA
ncbi:fluoride efflux transporter CrcB [Neotabrizicola sp. VNH66]|uniref:fluoride efflux transporter CrcB n=1 Tax=Neotabrizicola sp. VNH66 TaxID=3400918 RepID=UPI003C0B222D